MTHCECGESYVFPTKCPCGGECREDVQIAFDTKLRRPGCAIVQASFGCDPSVSHHFETDTWLLTPTPNMGVFTATPDQLDKLIDMANAAVQS